MILRRRGRSYIAEALEPPRAHVNRACVGARTCLAPKRRSRRVVKDDAQSVALTAVELADAVPHLDAAGAAFAGDGAVTDGEDDGVTLARLQDHGT